MARLRAHQVAGVKEFLAKWGASALQLPPSSPEYNPIETCWASIKGYLRKAAPGRLARLRAIMSSTGAQVTPALCTSWAAHCGYATEST